MKLCNTCEQVKEDLKFTKRKASNDGLAAMCKLCQKVYDKLRNKDPCRVEARRIYMQTDSGKIAHGKASKKHREKYPNKYKAHIIVNNAIRDEKLFSESCEECGKKSAHAHHDNYLKPLNVKWLCPACHKAWHLKNGEGLNP